MTTKYRNMLCRVDEKMMELYEDFIKKMRNEVVVPFLKKNNLHLDTGMGCCAIDTPDGEITFLLSSSELNASGYLNKVGKGFYKNDEEMEAAEARIEAIKALPGWGDVAEVLKLQSEYMNCSVGQWMEPYKGE